MSMESMVYFNHFISIDDTYAGPGPTSKTLEFNTTPICSILLKQKAIVEKESSEFVRFELRKLVVAYKIIRIHIKNCTN